MPEPKLEKPLKIGMICGQKGQSAVCDGLAGCSVAKYRFLRDCSKATGTLARLAQTAIAASRGIQTQETVGHDVRPTRTVQEKAQKKPTKDGILGDNCGTEEHNFVFYGAGMDLSVGRLRTVSRLTTKTSEANNSIETKTGKTNRSFVKRLAVCEVPALPPYPAGPPDRKGRR